MKILNSCLYNDEFNNFWKFILRDNGDLIYSIMYGEDKWSKESKIDTGVIDFAINVDDGENIHVVYSNRKGELRYCVWDSGQWFGKNIYSFDSITYEIKEISFYKIGKNMHVFYMLNNRKNMKKASLTHYTWNEENSKIQKISTINIIPDIQKHYDIDISKDNKIYLFFINYENNEGVLRSCEYEKSKWNNGKKLYSINGTNIKFSTLMNKDEIHILNTSKEGSKYMLEHVVLGKGGKIDNYKIHEGSKDMKTPMLSINSRVLSTIWMEEDKLLYSYFHEKWGVVSEININDDEEVMSSNVIFHNKKDIALNCKRIFCVTSPKIKLFLPVNNKNVEVEVSTQGNKEETLNNIDSIENVQELVKTKYINKNLEKKIVTLQMQLKQKERFMNEMEENLSRVIEQKRKTEEKYKIFVDVHQTVQKEMQDAKQKLVKEEGSANLLKRKLDEIISENQKFKGQCETIFKENENLKRNLNEISEQNEAIKNNWEQLNNEKIQILSELEEVKNKSFVYKFLKK